MEIENRLRELGLELPEPGQPAGTYIGCVQVDNLLFVGGNIGRIDGVSKYCGKVGAEVTIEQAYEMARNCCLNHLAVIKRELGDLDRVERIVKVLGYVNVADGFTELPLDQKILVWHLYQAAIAGRDIFYDQRYAHNLEMRDVLEEIITHPSGIDASTLAEIQRYTKLFWINTGPFNNLTARKFVLKCTPEAFAAAVVRVLCEPPLGTRLATNAARRVRAEFGWREVASRFASICGALRTERRERVPA